MTALTIGLCLALAVALFGRLAGFDRDRAFYCTILIVVGSYYILFAAMAGDATGVRMEILFFFAFAAAAVLAFRISMWIAAAGLALHGLFDFVRLDPLPAAGAPGWWPGFCAGFDVGAGAMLALLLLWQRRSGAR